MLRESLTDLIDARPVSIRKGRKALRPVNPRFLDFFAGCGLVTEALNPYFTSAWANDICEKKAAIYLANHPSSHFLLGAIEKVNGYDLPSATLSWASFPCQDLSLAGNMSGIDSSRSGLVWHWLRVMDEMQERPPLVVAENVVGLVSGANGEHYRLLHEALVKRGYRVGALLIDAASWVPQSRQRVFVVGVDQKHCIRDFEDYKPGWQHPPAIQKAAAGLSHWVWWRLPEPKSVGKSLEEIIDFNAPCDDEERAERNLRLIPPSHLGRIKLAVKTGARVFPGYKRTRNGRQVLEVRFDCIAGCLRTPEGGSSRQLLVLWRDGKLHTRLLTVREAASLMGAPKRYKIPGSYNEGYKAMGDAVAIPAARHLARGLLAPLARAFIST